MPPVTATGGSGADPRRGTGTTARTSRAAGAARCRDGSCTTSQASVISSAPRSTSSTQWLAVDTTTSAVTGAYAAARTRCPRVRASRQNTRLHHSAHPTCIEGMAANWLTAPPTPRTAEPSAPHQPTDEVVASVSVYPPTSRGGAVGKATYPTSATAVASTSAARSRRYSAGRER